MKKVMTVLAFFLMVGVVQASNQITLTWNPVDFVICGSDPNSSGYKLYKSMDEGVTKQMIGQVNTTLQIFVYTEITSGKYCYYATAFNQVGESPYSDPVCKYISDETPPAPTGLDAVVKVLQEISDTLKDLFK